MMDKERLSERTEVIHSNVDPEDLPELERQIGELGPA